ncbi:MAG: DUF4258 domain-containing protein [Acidobacteria bacterium]|nr:DUF4258 domain-containing protein [Acidobacteriota bacterium]
MFNDRFRATSHAAERMIQRNVAAGDIALVLRFGHLVYPPERSSTSSRGVTSRSAWIARSRDSSTRPSCSKRAS